jgi:hypothetical protein
MRSLRAAQLRQCGARRGPDRPLGIDVRSTPAMVLIDRHRNEAVEHVTRVGGEAFRTLPGRLFSRTCRSSSRVLVMSESPKLNAKQLSIPATSISTEVNKTLTDLFEMEDHTIEAGTAGVRNSTFQEPDLLTCQ